MKCPHCKAALTKLAVIDASGAHVGEGEFEHRRPNAAALARRPAGELRPAALRPGHGGENDGDPALKKWHDSLTPEDLELYECPVPPPPPPPDPVHVSKDLVKETHTPTDAAIGASGDLATALAEWQAKEAARLMEEATRAGKKG